jgi:hypothetical protein
MASMFQGASSFNQYLSFDTIQVTDMNNMFNGASSFNKPLSFNINSVTNMSNMLNNVNLSSGNYNTILINWADQQPNIKSNVVFDAGNTKYTSTIAKNAHDTLTNTYSWKITDGGYKPIFPCFKEGSKILTNQGYKSVENLRTGDLIKTVNHGLKPIYKIGKRVIYHPALKDRIKEQLYRLSKDKYPEIFEDLVLTGCHCILAYTFEDEEQKQKAMEINRGRVFVTDKRYRIPACLETKATVYEQPGNYTIYHFALENDDYKMNYGVYANGLLVETCSKRYLNEYSGMTII